MRNQNCETIEAMMQKIKIQTGENEARPDKVIRSMADEMADSILEDADENAARQFFYIFSQMEEWTKKGMLELTLEMVYVILRLFNYGEETEMIAVITNTVERQKRFVEAFIQCGKEICRSYME